VSGDEATGQGQTGDPAEHEARGDRPRGSETSRHEQGGARSSPSDERRFAAGLLETEEPTDTRSDANGRKYESAQTHSETPINHAWPRSVVFAPQPARGRNRQRPPSSYRQSSHQSRYSATD